jgi:hypothetical protein
MSSFLQDELGRLTIEVEICADSGCQQEKDGQNFLHGDDQVKHMYKTYVSICQLIRASMPFDE